MHIGQAGNQIAYSCWQLYCLEHGIFPDGTLYQTEGNKNGEDCNAFFGLTPDCHVKPRVLFIDLEPSVIDEIRLGIYKDLFSPSQIVMGSEDAASNYARGKLTCGSEMLEFTMDRIRCLVEDCSAVQGFMIFRALGGGTGSGFGNLIIEKLAENYKKVPKLEFDVFPSPKISPLIVEPYNSVLGVHDGMETIDCSIIFDNEALYEICAKRLGLNNIYYLNLNRIVAQSVSCVTSSLRFQGDINVDLAEFQTNLVPFKRIHFPLVSYAPLTQRRGGLDNQSTTQITNQVFDIRNQLVKCDPKEGKYMSCCILYRGDVCGIDINRAIQDIKSNRCDEFVDWSPTSFKIGINSQPPICVPGGDIAHSNRAVCMLSNNTAIKEAWQRLIEKFDSMMCKKAFIHHYVEEGMDEEYLKEAREDVNSLIDAYNEFDGCAGKKSGKI